jgi:hypothetical protein
MRQEDADALVIANARFGLVTRPQLIDAGFTEGMLRQRLASGRLLPEHRGVYRLGHQAPSTDATYLAAVLACGDAAVLAGMAAVWRYGLVRGRPPAPEVRAPGRHDRPGIICRQGATDPRDRTIFRSIPTVTVARALVELAPRVDAEELARACHEAGVRYGTTPAHVRDALSRWPAAPGAAKLRAVMTGDVHVSLSRLERVFLALLREQGLPLPVMNGAAGGRRVDCRWPAQRLTVELDSFGFHNSRHSWERDRTREREAYARGDEFRRYTWGDVTERPARMLRELRGLLLR